MTERQEAEMEWERERMREYARDAQEDNSTEEEEKDFVFEVQLDTEFGIGAISVEEAEEKITNIFNHSHRWVD